MAVLFSPSWYYRTHLCRTETHRISTGTLAWGEVRWNHITSSMQRQPEQRAASRPSLPTNWTGLCFVYLLWKLRAAGIAYNGCPPAGLRSWLYYPEISRRAETPCHSRFIRTTNFTRQTENVWEQILQTEHEQRNQIISSRNILLIFYWLVFQLFEVTFEVFCPVLGSFKGTVRHFSTWAEMTSVKYWSDSLISAPDCLCLTVCERWNNVTETARC